MKMRVKFAGAAATVQSCDITSGEDSGLHDASATARTEAAARMKGENFIQASLPICVHGTGAMGRAGHRLLATQEAATLKMAAPRLDFNSKLVARVYSVMPERRLPKSIAVLGIPF